MATKKEDRLTDQHLMKIGKKLEKSDMNSLAVIEMGFEKTELKHIWQEKRPSEALYNAAVMRAWKNRPSNSSKQKLADILYNNLDVIDAEVVKEILGVDKSDSAASADDSPKCSPRLTPRELGRLAKEIDVVRLQEIALLELETGEVKIANKKYNNPDDAWWVSFEILVDWTRKSPDNNRQKIKTILKDSGKIGEDVLNDILGEDVIPDSSEENEMEVTTTTEVDGSHGTDAAQDIVQRSPVTPDISVVPRCGNGQHLPDWVSKTHNNDTNMDQKPFASSMAPLSSETGPTDSQTDSSLQPLGFGKKLKTLLRGTKFPDGKQLTYLPTKEKRVEEGFDWLLFGMIIRATTDKALKAETKLVTVAVIDTGVYEEHKDLKNNIIRDQSRCFVKGTTVDKESLADLTIDERNHGTMVAGVIVLNGPEKVRIINLKVQPVRRENVHADMQPVVEALKHVKSLDGTENEVDIVNMSVGQIDYQEGLAEIVDELAQTKILVSSAGNYAAHASNTVTFPAKLANIIAVGACDSAGHTCDESSRGREVLFLCPGEGVVSTSNIQNGYFVCNGTSFSSPHAAAVAAHVLVAMEAKKYRDARDAKKSEIQAKQEGLDFRKKLRKNRVMRNVFLRMCDAPVAPGGAGVLHPYKNCFRNPEFLYDYCNTAVESGREDYVYR